MGTISEKLTYLNGTKQELKQKINNLGGSIDDNTTFRNYANQLQNIYDNLPKTSFQEGTEITLSNTLKGKLDFDNGVVGIGQSSQDSTSGTNLANTTGYIAPTTTNGITYSLENNIISLNGTSTASFYINLPGKFDLASGNYTFAPADISGTYTGVCGKYPCVNGTDIFDGNQLSTLVNRSLNSDYTDVFIRLFVSNGSSYSNYKCKLNLVKGTYTAQTIPAWEKYTGGQASPNPSYPQNIEVVRGKNRLNFSIVGKVPSVNGGGLVDSPYGATTELIPIYGEDYVLSYSATGAKPYVFYYGDNNTFLGSANQIDSGYTISTSIYFSSAKYIRIRTDNFSVLNNTNTQLEKGSQATPYLPYNTIEETIRSKNVYKSQLYTDNVEILVYRCTVALNNDEWAMTATGADAYVGELIASGQSYNSSRGFKIYRNGHSKISFRMTNTNFRKNIFTAYNKNNVSLGWTGINNDTGTYTFPDGCEYVTFRFGNGTASVGTTYKTKVILAYGDEIPTYEPYITPQTYQLSLGDIELCGIGDYKDELIYDVDEDKVYKNVAIKKLVLDGNETITNDYTAFDISLPNRAILGEGAYCNYYTYDSRSSGMASLDNYTFAFQAVKVFIQNKDYSSVDSFKGWLNVNKPIIYYPLYTTQKTEITDTTLVNQIKALYYSHSLNGTTIITSNGNLPMIIKVRGLKGE